MRSRVRLAKILANNVQSFAGLVINPAHKINPTRFGGRVAANIAASGVENDSATSTNGVSAGTISATKGRRSSYERNRCAGYLPTITSSVGGRCETKSANKVPVPSRPGKSTSAGALKFLPGAAV